MKARALLAELRPYLGQLDAELEQCHAIARIAVVHDRRIGRRQRVGENPYMHALASSLANIATPSLPGTKYGEITMSSCLEERIRVARSLSIVSSSSAESSPAIFAGRSASTVAGTHAKCSFPASSSGPSQLASWTTLSATGGEAASARAGQASEAIGYAYLLFQKASNEADNSRYDRTRPHHVQIDEIVFRIAREVFVADVAAAGDGERIVRHEQLVVHAMIDAPDVGHRQQKAGPRRESSAGKRIEHPHLDVCMFAQMQEAPIFARRIEIIDQNAHPHAPIRREAHMMQQQPRGIVLMNDVVLNVQRALGMVRERDEVGQGLFPRGEEVNARQALVGLLARDDAAERGGLGPGNASLWIYRRVWADRRSRPSRAQEPSRRIRGSCSGTGSGVYASDHDIRHTLRPCKINATFAVSSFAPAA